MKKILEMLEQKVQWIALTLGVLYVGYMVWAYLINSPVTVDVNGSAKVPGEVDKSVLEVARQLDAKMTSTTPPTNIEAPPQYVASFKSKMDYSDRRAQPNEDALVYYTYGSVKTPGSEAIPMPPMPGRDLIPGPNPSIAPGPTPPGPAPLAGPVDKLPVLPVAVITHTNTGLSNVNPKPSASNSPAPAEVVPGVDKTWVTVRYEVDGDALAAEFEKSKFPNNLRTTAFLQIVLTRQELMPDGTWGKETIVPTLPFHGIPPFPAGGPTPTQYEFIKWAGSHQGEIVQPAFYPVLKAAAWFIPGEQAPLTAAAAAFKPENYLTATPDELMRLTSDQRRLVQAHKEKVAREANRGRGARNPAPRPTPRGAFDIDAAPANAPIDLGRPSFQVQQPEVDVNASIDMPIENANPGGPAAAVRIAPAASAAGGNKFPIPGSEFDPKVWQGQHARQPLVGWAHDETATPGATYRYKISYKLKNPVFGNKPAVKEQSLMEKLSIDSADSAWSSPVDVASTVSFFVQGPPRDSTSSVPIQVFSFKGGQPLTKIYNVMVGSRIGGAEAEADFSTGWTVVDYSRDPRPATTEWVIILMDARGNLRRRLMSEDMKNEQYNSMKQSVVSAAPAAAAN